MCTHFFSIFRAKSLALKLRDVGFNQELISYLSLLAVRSSFHHCSPQVGLGMKKTAQYVIFRSEIISIAEGRLKNKRVNPPMLCIDHFQLQKSHKADEGV